MSQVLTEAIAVAQRRNDLVLPNLKRWVETNSFSRNLEGVNAMGEMLAEDFSFPGFAVERIPGNGVADHWVWKTPAWEREPDGRILLIGHHDTVFPQGTFDVWDLQGDRLRGPGVLDMKGGLVTIWAALGALAEVGYLESIPLAFVSVGDEEIGSRDSKTMVQALAKGARGAVVFEAGRTEDRIITQRKGTGSFQIEVEGKAAHAGNHHKEGINSIVGLARLIESIQAITDYDRGITVNVGTIQGGSSTNTVPAHAECTVDFRFVRIEDGEFVVDELHRAATETDLAGGKVTLSGGIRRPPLERSDDSVALYQRYAKAAAAAGLGATECPLIGGGSDANTVSAVGVPAIDGLGPRGKGFHTHDEYIEISSLPLRIDALIRFLVSW